LDIWWTKGLVLAEDEAIQRIVKDWEKHSSIPVNLSFHKQDNILDKLAIAEQAGTLPNILYAYKGDLALHPRFAWEGKLLDLSIVIHSGDSSGTNRSEPTEKPSRSLISLY
jgi:multiple sugar transport system substrate-binding protein